MSTGFIFSRQGKGIVPVILPFLSYMMTFSRPTGPSQQHVNMPLCLRSRKVPLVTSCLPPASILHFCLPYCKTPQKNCQHSLSLVIPPPGSISSLSFQDTTLFGLPPPPLVTSSEARLLFFLLSLTSYCRRDPGLSAWFSSLLSMLTPC